MPSMAPMMATETCVSSLPLMPSDNIRAKVEMPMPIQMAIMARPTVVSGLLCGLARGDHAGQRCRQRSW